MLKTALYDTHLKYQGEMVEFAGYSLPIQYATKVVKEHMATREQCGLFDVSHMGEILITGENALSFLNYVLTNDFTNMADQQARYSPMLNEEGKILDDLIVYKIKENAYFIVVNASNKEKDYNWFKSKQFENMEIEDVSDQYAQLALQGPNAEAILKRVCEESFIPTKYYTANFNGNIQGIDCIISKTGYTGELGYELYLKNENAEKLWELLIENGKDLGLIPCGLAARDTLRLEAAMPLYGHEMSEDITPFEAKIGSFVKMDKEDFIGKKALLEYGENKCIRIGIKAVDRGIIRENTPLYFEDKVVGITTSGTHCPYVGVSCAMALVDVAYSEIGMQLTAIVRNRKIGATIVELPFYKRKK